MLIKKNDKFLTSKDLVYIALFITLLYICGFIKIYILSVPFTMQTLIALCIPCFLSFKKALITVLVFIIGGLIGIPFFTEGGGFYYIYKPTFGYILSFIIGVFLISPLKVKFIKNRILLTVYLFFVSIIMLAFGALYAYFLYSFVLNISVPTGFLNLFFFPFIPAEFLKSIVAALLYFRLNKIIKI